MFNFKFLKTYIPLGNKWKKEKNFEKKSFSFRKKSFPVPIPKLDLGFSSRYQNLVLVSNYFHYRWSSCSVVFVIQLENVHIILRLCYKIEWDDNESGVKPMVMYVNLVFFPDCQVDCFQTFLWSFVRTIPKYCFC